MDFINNKNLKIVCSDDQLTIYSHKYCNDDSDEFIKSCRGVIVDKEGELVVKTHPYTRETTSETIEKDLDLTKYEIFDSFEGTAIRVFYYNQWYVSTFKKLNAGKSYWNSEVSFGETFERRVKSYYDSVDTFFDCLDDQKVYIFLLQPTPETRLVSQPLDDLLHIDTFEIRSGERTTGDLFIPKPKQLQFENMDMLLEYVEGVDPNEQQGVLLRNETSIIKVLNTTYEKVLRLRNPSFMDVGIRYLTLSIEDKEELRKWYPDFNFSNYTNALIRVTTYLYNCQLQRRKEYVRVNTVENTVLKYFDGEITIENMEKAILKQQRDRLHKIIYLHKDWI